MSSESLNYKLSKKCGFLIGICVGSFMVLILGILSIWVMFWRKSQRKVDNNSLSQILFVSKDIRVDRVGEQSMHDHHDCVSLTVNDNQEIKTQRR